MPIEITVIDPAQPVVTTHGRDVVTNSRDVARYFRKEHRHVLDAIDKLLQDLVEVGVPNFRQTPYVEPANGQTYRSFDMDRKAFTILVMGFSGKKALAFKVRYIDAFDAMEAEIGRRGQGAIALDPNDPAQLRALLIDYSDRTLALQGRVSELEPKERALDRIATASGSLCITDAAKALQMHPKTLFTYMRGHGWLYRRAGSSRDKAFEDKRAAGFLELKMTEPDGAGRTFEQVRVTPKGLARLGELFSQPLPLQLEMQRSA